MYGLEFTVTDLENVGYKELYLSVNDAYSELFFTEIHVYTTIGDYIGSTYNNTLILDSESNSLHVDVYEVFNTLGIDRGNYKIIVNVYSPVLGIPDVSVNNKPFFVQEISPERTELKLVIKDTVNTLMFQQFRDFVYDLTYYEILNTLIINFGKNNIGRVVNLRFDERDNNVFYVKLNKPLHESVIEQAQGWIAIEIMDSYIDNVSLVREIIKPAFNVLRNPNFDMDADEYDSASTMYKTWNELLDTNAQTSQNIIDRIVSGSSEATINIDYTDFGNYIFYSHAEERIDIFYEKISQIEIYESDIVSIESSTTGSIKGYTKSSRDTIQERIDTIKSSFDPFERWLYYSPIEPIFTHDVSGSVSPIPKQEINNEYVYYSTGSNEIQTWYTNHVEYAKEFDRTNYNSLWWSIPEHILMDTNNSEYVMFVNMIGHHFDVMYMYINALTEIHNKDEHPQRGASNDLLFYIAKSFGWNLQHNRALSDLWSYKLGTDADGKFVDSSNMRINSHETQTHILWKRIVNNLPLLLKTKGTDRSIKALMSIYGIPQTLLSIKEYGGATIDSITPLSIRDMFSYKLHVDGLNDNDYIKIPQDTVNVASYGWEDGGYCDPPNQLPTSSKLPDTYEFRFSTREYDTGSLSVLFTKTNNSAYIGDSINSIVYIVHSDIISSSFGEVPNMISGSKEFGKIIYSTFGDNAQYHTSSYLPLFNGDMWTVRIYKEADADIFQIAQARDCSHGVIQSNVNLVFENTEYSDDTTNVYFGSFREGMPIGSTLKTVLLNNTPFSGSNVDVNYSNIYVQAYKEYYTTYSDATFNNHVLNQYAYNTDSPSGSFYSLYRYYGFGIDNQKYDHTAGPYSGEITSSLFSLHPDRSKLPSHPYIYINSKPDDSEYAILNETAYAQVPRIGGIPIQNNKIRIESGELVRELSSDSRSEVSENDTSGYDSNRLAIVFSTADYINEDIANHMGFADLDFWIGDPEFEFDSEYKELRNRRNDYFQKYEQRNDINALIRLLSLYDYTFFEQLKQLVPARADLISGILIEPHILNRSKVQLSHRPKIKRKTLRKDITYTRSIVGKNPTLKTIVGVEHSVDAEVTQSTGSVNLNEVVCTDINILETTILDPVTITADGYDVVVGVVKVIDTTKLFTGSIKEIIDVQRPDCRYFVREYTFQSYQPKDSLIVDPFIKDDTKWVITNYNTTIVEPTDLGNIDKHDRLKTSIELTYLAPTASSARSFDSVPGMEYVCRVHSSIKTITGSVNLGVNIIRSYYSGSIQVSSSYSEVLSILNRSIDGVYFADEYRFIFTGSNNPYTASVGHSAGESISVSFNYLGTNVDPAILIYSSEIHAYLGSDYNESWARKEYSDLLIEKGYSEKIHNYQNDEHLDRNTHRFRGSKLVGPGINIDSPNTYNGRPVIEIRTVNPNSLKMGDGGKEGNLRLS